MRGALLAALPAIAAAAYGVDLSQALDQTTANCLVQQASASFGIVRAWCSYGGFDGNAPGSVAAMWNAGAAHVDVYMFPCAGQVGYGCGDLLEGCAAHFMRPRSNFSVLRRLRCF